MRRSSNPQPGLGIAIRQLRAQRGSTQETLAKNAGVTVSHFSAIESGHSNPTWSTVRGIAKALGVSVAELAKTAERFEE